MDEKIRETKLEAGFERFGKTRRRVLSVGKDLGTQGPRRALKLVSTW